MSAPAPKRQAIPEGFAKGARVQMAGHEDVGTVYRIHRGADWIDVTWQGDTVPMRIEEASWWIAEGHLLLAP